MARRRSASGPELGAVIGLAILVAVAKWIGKHPVFLLIPLALGVVGVLLYRKRQQAVAALHRAHLEAERARRQAILASGISQIDEMSGAEFEERLLLHFQERGWQLRTTRASGDFGADLVGTRPDGVGVVIQAKRWHGRVGVGAVQEVHGARDYYQAQLAMLITNSTLTAPARDLAARTRVEVWDRERLIHELTKPPMDTPPTATAGPKPQA